MSKTTDSHGRRIHYRACNLCEAICGIAIEVEEGRVVSIRGDEEDPFSRGFICPKALALQDIQTDPDRLRRPLRRVGDAWHELSWKEALDEVAGRIQEIRGEHGPDALAVYLGNPNVHNHGPLLYGLPLLRLLRTKNRFSATSVDQLPHHVAARFMFGHQLLLPIPDLDRTSFLLMLGANPIASNGSLMTAPGMRRRLAELAERGGQLVVVDPRWTETARVAQRHYFIRPGTDALLLLALLHTIFDEELENPGHLAPLVDSLDELRSLVADVPPERVAKATGIDAGDIRELAHAFARAPSAICYGRLGVSTQEFGGLCHWLINALNIVTGNLDRSGGVMFTRPAIDLLDQVGRGHLGRWKSRVRGLPEFANELPAATMADEMLADGDDRIRALLTVAGNPVLSTPDGRRLERALENLDFMVSIDLYLNETTRHADIILPPTAPLERDHYDLVFNLLAVRNVTRYSPALFEPDADARHDWQIFGELQKRLGGQSIRQQAGRWLAAVAGPRGLLDLGLRFGPYGGGLNPFSGLSLARLESSPHGLDLGPLQPCLPDRLRSKSRRIELVPELFRDDLPRLMAHLDPTEGAGGAESAPDDTLLLIGRRHLQSNNSWMHNYERLMGGRERCTLLMHPDDAERLRLADGQPVEVVSRVGRITVPLVVSADMMPGTVSLPHGWGHHRDGTRLTVAGRRPGASLNDVTDAGQVDRLTGTAVLNGTPVTVQPAAQ